MYPSEQGWDTRIDADLTSGKCAKRLDRAWTKPVARCTDPNLARVVNVGRSCLSISARRSWRCFRTPGKPNLLVPPGACGSCERYQRPPVQDSARAAQRVNGTVSDAQSLVGSTLGKPFIARPARSRSSGST
jgi:hypothetical protein